MSFKTPNGPSPDYRQPTSILPRLPAPQHLGLGPWAARGRARGLSHGGPPAVESVIRHHISSRPSVLRGSGPICDAGPPSVAITTVFLPGHAILALRLSSRACHSRPFKADAVSSYTTFFRSDRTVAGAARGRANLKCLRSTEPESLSNARCEACTSAPARLLLMVIAKASLTGTREP
eukprot:763187-Hanusia_phi.AAC.4